MTKKNRHKNTSKNKPERQAASAISWISGAVFILGLAVLAGIYWERNASISEVRFSGIYFSNEEELESAFETPIGAHPDSVQYFEIINGVNALPFVKNSGVSVDARGRMTIEITERQPLAMLIDGNNRVYVDENGIKLPLIFGKSVNVPLLHGFASEPQSEALAGDEFEAVRDFLTATRENELGWITISEVAYNRDEGVVALSHENGVKLLFGYGDYDQKMRHWAAFYTEVVRRKGIGHLATVDMRYRNQIVTRDI